MHIYVSRRTMLAAALGVLHSNPARQSDNGYVLDIRYAYHVIDETHSYPHHARLWTSVPVVQSVD